MFLWLFFRSQIKNKILPLTILASCASSVCIFAEDSPAKKAEESVQDGNKQTKKALRKVDDKVCDVVNGKKHCVRKKIKHKLQNTGDEINDKVEDIKH